MSDWLDDCERYVSRMELQHDPSMDGRIRNATLRIGGFGMPVPAATYTHLERLLSDLRRLLAVARAAQRLKDSGYDGPMMGDVVAPLFAALEGLEREEG